MTTYIAHLESNIYNMSFGYGEPFTIIADSYEQALEQVNAIVASASERDNVAIRSLKTTDTLIAEHQAKIAELTAATYLDLKPELREALIGYELKAIAKLDEVAA